MPAAVSRANLAAAVRTAARSFQMKTRPRFLELATPYQLTDDSENQHLLPLLTLPPIPPPFP